MTLITGKETKLHSIEEEEEEDDKLLFHEPEKKNGKEKLSPATQAWTGFKNWNVNVKKKPIK